MINYERKRDKKAQPVPESNTQAQQFNRWRPEPAYLYKSGVYKKGERQNG